MNAGATFDPTSTLQTSCHLIENHKPEEKEMCGVDLTGFAVAIALYSPKSPNPDA